MRKSEELYEQGFILKTFQLKAARAAANIELKTIGYHLGLTKAAISLWEQKGNLIDLSTSKENIRIMKEIFARHNVFFPDENSISFNDIMEERELEGLTRFQLKTARVILGISQAELANFFNISRHIIARAELLGNNQFMHSLNKKIPTLLKDWFESGNITFKDGLTVSFNRDKKLS